MQRSGNNRQIRKRLTYANVMSSIAVFLTLGGASALAANQLAKNSVGSRQLKSKAVTTGKIANGSLTGSDINVKALGTVPSATTATNAGNANTLAGHSAACPPATALIRGVCFDAQANPVANTQKEAADACAAKGGWLPSPMELYAVRGVLNLGTGIGSEHQYTDMVYANTAGVNYSTVTVDGTGAITEQSITSPSRYTCAYALVR